MVQQELAAPVRPAAAMQKEEHREIMQAILGGGQVNVHALPVVFTVRDIQQHPAVHCDDARTSKDLGRIRFGYGPHLRLARHVLKSHSVRSLSHAILP
jgi:hypothetical protein